MTIDELMTCIAVPIAHYKTMKSDITPDEVKKINTVVTELVFDTFLSDK